MKRNYETRFKESEVTHVCDNGLTIHILEKPRFQTTVCLLATPFGSLDVLQKDETGKIIQHPMGSAHFLEHQVFEMDQCDVMSEFGKLGANVNAYTSYDETCYYFSTPSKDLKEPLNLLLDFVQSLAITEESVNKEKKIIEQELMMYEQDAGSRLSLEAYRSMYKNLFLNEDIVGTRASIQEISVASLKLAYELNYHPSRMDLTLFSPVSSEEIIAIVEENQAKKSFSKGHVLTRIMMEEPTDVNQARKDVHLAISEPRSLFGIKLKAKDLSKKELLFENWCLKMCMDAYFSSLNPDYQSWIDQHKISNYFAYEQTLEEGYGYLLFYDDCENGDEFEDFLKNQMELFHQTPIKEETLNQLKKRVLGSFLDLFDDPETFAITTGEAHRRGVSIYEEIEMVEKLTCKDCMETLASYSFNSSILVNLQDLKK